MRSEACGKPTIGALMPAGSGPSVLSADSRECIWRQPVTLCGQQGALFLPTEFGQQLKVRVMGNFLGYVPGQTVGMVGVGCLLGSL